MHQIQCHLQNEYPKRLVKIVHSKIIISVELHLYIAYFGTPLQKSFYDVDYSGGDTNPGDMRRIILMGAVVHTGYCLAVAQ